MGTLTRITLDPAVMGGKACIRGLRVTVGTVVPSAVVHPSAGGDSPQPSTESDQLHRVKGLEFDRIVIASANENLVPLAAAIPEDDGPARAAAETSERALLYVAATRAKKDVTVLLSLIHI